MIELCTAALLYAASAGAPGAAPFTVFDAQGAQVELATLCNAMDDADVVFLGELHNDSTAHAIQLELASKSGARVSVGPYEPDGAKEDGFQWLGTVDGAEADGDTDE